MPPFRILPRRLFTEPAARVTRVEAGDDRGEATVHIEGLVCSACAANVKREIEAVAGVQSAVVDLDRGEAVVTYDPDHAVPSSFVTAAEGAVLLRPVRRVLASISGHRAKSRIA